MSRALVSTIVDLNRELERARAKFPGNKNLLPALMEEVGELATALMENEGTDRVRAEALQVACVALRIFEEGEPAFPQEVPDAVA